MSRAATGRRTSVIPPARSRAIARHWPSGWRCRRTGRCSASCCGNYGKLGEVLAGSGDSAAAIANSRLALAIAEQLAERPGATPRIGATWGACMCPWGGRSPARGKIQRGLMLMNQGTAIFESLVDADPRTRAAGIMRPLRMGGWGKFSWVSSVMKLHSSCIPSNSSSRMRWQCRIRLTRSCGHLEAYALLGMAAVLSKRGASQDALLKQTEASNTLRALFDADAKDTEARYNAAFALSEVSATLASLGQFQAAELKLRDALAIIEPLAGTEDPAMEHARALQTTATTRLESITAQRQSSA